MDIVEHEEPQPKRQVHRNTITAKKVKAVVQARKPVARKGKQKEKNGSDAEVCVGEKGGEILVPRVASKRLCRSDDNPDTVSTKRPRQTKSGCINDSLKTKGKRL